ncbi:MAG: glycosyltransferase family 39 protein [Candidatus Omnitrophica bacterium]|nr:glycosyltransferase family 39 protein [Candidatus Omnitrophota bacterium]
MNQKGKTKIILILIGIFLIALLPRLIIAFYSRQIPVNDASGYDTYALNLLAGKGFVNPEGELTSWREPLYPYFLSCIYYFFGHSYLAVRLIHAVLGAFTCIIIFLIAHRSLGLRIAIVSALIGCFNPTFIKLTEHLLTENLFTFLFALSALFLLRQISQKRDHKNLICAGVLLGLTTLTRSVTLLFPLFVLLFLGKRIALREDDFKKYSLSVLIFIFSFFLTIAPWTVRNWRVHHKFVPVVSRTGLGLYSSFVPRDGKTFGFNADDEITKKAESLSTEVERSNFLAKQALKHIKDNPSQLFKLEILKILFFWAPFDWSILAGGVYNFAYGFILPFFILGIFASFKRFEELALIYLPIIYIQFFVLITFGIPRFRLPIEPFIIIIASIGIDKFLRRFSKKIFPYLLMLSFFLVNLLIYFNSYQVKLFLKSILEGLKIW